MVPATITTPVRAVTVTSNGQSIIRVESREPDVVTDGGAEGGTDQADASDPLLTEALRQLRAYFGGTLSTFDLPLDLGQISATARTVLTTLDETVASGTTITYGELARRSGTGIHARGIGSIMGMNPLLLVIACHRVVASDGLGSYSGGCRGTALETKRWLLDVPSAISPRTGSARCTPLP
ncbi:MAG: methylated-DNA--[protein]-cysteine S-methyltransferase [Brevibacterium sp.]|nr:methylated-DNA--[protein]-cysteine S-methyltransferase [Brevibacterium sp.]MDN5832494.1 methylated-DNA--[protein]-cysteine S-methyltransferase [Brevibacterium sp.]MDN5875152.1 methylated-DNA--[protein]-cysteine S-methyltransferase [Brevibacterium sp.]MDN5908275.1 methylated-DNA--[protein]-cysteine S-methyltransferase [Brevibacterium sp.]MDN6122534.1 methylated-DNA--[protein]-cysteine S-methyltransferase [Brevibacterium sp.]